MINVRREGRVWIIAAEAPAGYVWRASGTHEYIAATFYTKPSRADRDAALAECFTLGTRPCTITACEWCEELGR